MNTHVPVRICSRVRISSIRLLVICTVLSCCVVIPVRAQTTTIQGIVMDGQSGERIPYATVLLKGTNSAARSNVEGIFVLPHAPARLCSLEVRYLGYVTQEVRVDARIPVSNLVVKMKQTILAGDEVTIIAEPEPRTLKSEKEPSLVALSPGDLSALPNLGEVDIFRALQLLPGVSGTNESSSGLYVRGGAPDQNLVLFDGMTVHHVDHFFGFFSAFNVDAVKDVRFYKGGFPAKYGGVLSSVVDMTGRTGDQNRWHGGVGASLLSAHGDVEVPLWQQGSLFLAGRTTYGDSKLAASIYKYLTGNQIGSTTPGRGGPGGGGPPGNFSGANYEETIPLPSFYDLNAKFTYYLTPGDVVSASLYHSNDALDKSVESQMGNTTDVTDQTNLGFSGRWFHQWTDDLFSNLVVANSRYTSNYSFGVEMSDTSRTRLRAGGIGTVEDNAINEFSVRLDNEWHPHQDHVAGFGLQLTHTTTSYSLTLTDPFRATTSHLVGLDQKGLQAAVYAQDEWAIMPAMTLTMGGRATYYQPTGQVFLDPRISGRYALTENIALKGAVGRYRQFLNRIVNENISQGSRDFWVLTGDQFRPGSSDHVILGATWENADLLFDIEAYTKNMTGLVEFSQRFRTTAADLYAFAAGEGTSRGIEFLLQKKYGMYTGWIAYTLSTTEYSFPAIAAGATFPAAQDQRHELKIVNALSLGPWKFGANWIYGSGTPYTAPVSQYYLSLLDGNAMTYIHVGEKNGMRLPAYHRLDMSVSRTFKNADEGMSFTAGLSVFNVYDRKNVSYYTYDMSTSPVTISTVGSLGITPTLFVQLDF
jgi:ferric enterobactin receptor